MLHKRVTWLTILGGLTLAYLALRVVSAEGTVVDQATGKPVAGAFVVTYWNGNTGWLVQPNTSCYYVEATRTDKNGKFNVSTFTGNLNPLRMNRTRNIFIYVPRYEISPNSNEEKFLFLMTPRAGPKTEQFKAVIELGSQGAGCSSGDLKARVPYLKALHDELAALAATAEQYEKVESVLFAAESLEFGDEIARQKYQTRRGDNPSANSRVPPAIK